MARKTVDVEFVREWVNRILDPVQCPELNADNRATAASILSGILHETGNYHGFKFHDVTVDESGHTVVGDESARWYY